MARILLPIGMGFALSARRRARIAAVLGLAWLLPLPAAANPLDAAAEFTLAQRYEHAEGVPLDYKKALELYCDAARQGHVDAPGSIGWMFLNGRGVARDDAAAVAWFRVAAQRGSVQSANLVKRLGDVAPGETSGCRGSGRILDASKLPAAIVNLATKAAAEYKLDPKLVLAVIATESGFDAVAVSRRNARGLMQLMPETARRFGVKDAFDPADNIRGGAKYLRWLLARFDGDLRLALSAYNAGERAVAKYGGVPPYAETRSYLDKVRSLY